MKVGKMLAFILMIFCCASNYVDDTKITCSEEIAIRYGDPFTAGDKRSIIYF